MFAAEQTQIEALIREIGAQNGWPEPGLLAWSPIPFSGEWGISTSFFSLAAQEARDKGIKINVPARAQEMAQAAANAIGKPAGFSHIEAKNGYLNVYFDSGEFTRRVVDTVLEQGAGFGRGEPKHETWMVEFSNPNTHKAMHVGHLRSAIFGDVLCRILDFAGYDVVRANYIGDIGLHVIKWLWNYQKHHKGERPGKDVTRWMGDLYAEASRRLEDNPELETEVRQVYARWDQRDPEIVGLWEMTRQWSMEGFEQIYGILGIPFDRWYSNSEVEQAGKIEVNDLIARGIAVDERPDGPVIVRIDDLLGLKKEKYRVAVILRSDGTALYATEDLALAKLKFSEYDLAHSVYVVDVRQALHFQQIFKILEIAGFEPATRCFHLAYEVVNLPGNVVIASREGNVVLLEDLIREAFQRALEVVTEKNPELDNAQKKAVAQAVGLGSLKYPMLSRDNVKTVTFDWEQALDFNGQASPYIQSAHVRANSILRKAGGEFPEPCTPHYPLAKTEVQLIDLISRVPGEVQRAAAEYKTMHISSLAYEVARSFNDFYNECPVLKAEPEVRDARLRLVAASRQAIANLLGLLGIGAPDVM
jgi:arginyl-tRNA synthetase